LTLLALRLSGNLLSEALLLTGLAPYLPENLLPEALATA
jgi:hypothetical protein